MYNSWDIWFNFRPHESVGDDVEEETSKDVLFIG